jgi:DNA repair protein RadA/Sms
MKAAMCLSPSITAAGTLVQALLANSFRAHSLKVQLAGEVRPAPRRQERQKEAAKLGFGMAVVRGSNWRSIAII